MMADAAFPDYDTSAALEPASCIPPAPPADPPGGWSGTLSGALERTLVWDSVFFWRIAACGYEHEQFFAFFPLLPALLAPAGRLACATAACLGLELTYKAGVALAGLLLSLVATTASAVLLAALTDAVLVPPALARAPKEVRGACCGGDEPPSSPSGTALRTALLFCAGPAGAFYSACYSEALYAALSLAGMCALHVPGRPVAPQALPPPARHVSRLVLEPPPEHLATDEADKLHRSPPFRPGPGRYLTAACFFAAAAATRANGVLNAGFFLFPAAQAVLDVALLSQKSESGASASSTSAIGRPAAGVTRVAVALRLAASLAAAVAGCAAVAAPNVLFQVCGDLCLEPPPPAANPDFFTARAGGFADLDFALSPP